MMMHLVRNSLFWFGLTCLAAGILAVSVIAYHQHKESKLESSGAVIVGTVDSKRVDVVPGTRQAIEEFLVAYRFKAADGSSQSGEGLVDPDFFDSVEAGDEIEVLYDTDDPARHRLVATEPAGDVMSLVLVGAGIVFALIGLLLLRRAVHKAA